MKNTIVTADKKIEFEELAIGPPGKLHVGVFGRGGKGKTRIGATAPKLGVIPTQRNVRPTVEQVIKNLYPDRKIYWPKNADEFIRHKNPMELTMMTREESKAYHRALLDRIKCGCWSLLDHPGVETILLDSGYDLYDITLAAHYGKSRRFISSAENKVAYGPPNDEFRELIRSLQEKNLIITTEAGEAYNGSKALGYDEPKGYKQLEFDVNVMVECRYTPDDGFWIDVRKCQDRAELMGEAGQKLLVGDMVEFKYLAAQIRQDTEPEDWE